MKKSVEFHAILTPGGCGKILGLVLCRKPKTLSISDGAERAKGDLDPLLVAPADVGVHGFNELLNGRGLPIPRIEQFRFIRPKNPSHAALSGELPLRDIERNRFASLILDSQPGQR